MKGLTSRRGGTPRAKKQPHRHERKPAGLLLCGDLWGICTPINCTELGGVKLPSVSTDLASHPTGILGFVSFTVQRLIN